MAPVRSPSKKGIFIFRIKPALIAGFMFLVLLGLGFWQIQRLHWKTDLISTIDARMQAQPVDVAVFSGVEADYRPAYVSGTYLNDREVFLYAISLKGEGGYDVLTPLRLKDGRVLLVNRGWIPYAAKKETSFSRISGAITVTGTLREIPKPSWMQPDNHPEKDEWYGVDLTVMAKAKKLDAFLPYVLEANATPNDALPQGGQTRADLPNNHLQYAITWFALAVILAVIFLLSCYRKNDAD